ncbi:MAG: class I SAM-dependent methyltransferase [Woeseiaceae bacterium]|nr:class I SAM-dependent methyltransferase [Woeseiaceae bacterium]
MFLSKVELLPKELLVQTSEVDHADWNYRLVLGKIQRVRFQLIKSLLRHASGNDLLEVGYGSGVFFPELLKTCKNIAGIDPHPMTAEVTESIAKADISADLRSGSVTDMPFADDSFDVVVAISALEYVDDIDTACREIIRVMRPGGIVALVTPGKSPILDLGLKVLARDDADSNYGDRREKLIAALERHFEVSETRRWPWPGIPWLTAYRALRLVAKPS